MNTFFRIIGDPLIFSGLMLAQSSAPMPTAPHEWTGLLVAAGCSPESSADRMSDMSTSGKTTSPHETNTDYEQRVNQADRTNQSNAAEATGMGESWNDAQQVAKQMPNSCRITTATTAFALRLRDGRLVNFGNAGNAQILQQLRSNSRIAAHQMKIFRVTVKGEIQGQMMTLDSIRL